MANSQNPQPPTYRPSKREPGKFVPNQDETQRQGQGTQPDPDRRDDASKGAERNADKVEIGEPVPEKDRTPRASERADVRDGQVRRGQGETGEDEDLPDDDSGVEGSRSERH